jgi:hypothetical protein
MASILKFDLQLSYSNERVGVRSPVETDRQGTFLSLSKSLKSIIVMDKYKEMSNKIKCS